MKFQLETYNRNTPDEKLIDDLKQVAIELEKSPTIDEYNERGTFHATTITRRFGSWFNALEKAGLKNTRSPINISEEELFKNLEEMWVKLGHQPHYREVLKPFSRYSAGTYDKRFGSFRKALEAFVKYMVGEEFATTEESIGDISEETFTKHKTKRDINWRLRFLVMRRDNFKCQSCGRSPATDPSIVLHVDHIKAWANGGETILDNLQSLCSRCNIGKSDLDSHELES